MKYIFLITGLILGMIVNQQADAQTVYTIQHSSTCTGSPVVFNSNYFELAQFPDTVRWNFGDTASGLLNTTNGLQSPSHSYSTTGTYIVSVYVVNPGSPVVILYDTVVIVAPVAFNFGADVYKCGDTGTHLLSAPLVAGALYEWNDENLTTTPALTITETGTYTVKINGCPVTDTIGVFFIKEPNLDLGADHVLCQGEQLTLNASSENATYQWRLNGADLTFAESQLPVAAPGGTYIANIDVTGCGAYSDTVSITFSNYPAPDFDLGPDTLLCPREIFSLTANAAGGTAFMWSSKGLSIDDMVNYNIFNGPIISIRQRGRYWAFASIGKQCEVVDTVIVRYRGDKRLDFNDTALCLGSTLVLDADFGIGTYKWESIPKQRDDQNNTNQSTYFVYTPGFYSVTAQVGHCIFQDSLKVVFDDSLKLALPRDTVLCQGEKMVIKASASTSNFIWQNGSKGYVLMATQTGLYQITSQNGCGADTASMNIVFESCPCSLILPSAFTPNGDGKNDYFRPLHACDMKDFRMTIYNRLGQQVFVSNDPLRGWGGMLPGYLLNQEAYVWSVSYTRPSNNHPVQKQGSVLLLR